MENFYKVCAKTDLPLDNSDISDLSRYLSAIFLPFMTDFEVNDNFDSCSSFSFLLFLRFPNQYLFPEYHMLKISIFAILSRF